ACLAYGARQELVDAIKGILLDHTNGKIGPEDICEERVAQYLYTSGMPDPDLVIRTSGEERVSNFSHSTQFSGGAPTPLVIPLQLGSHTPILGHHLQRPSDQRVTHAQHRPPDPRKPDDHHRFPEQSDVFSAAWRWQSVCRIRDCLHPVSRLSAETQSDVSWWRMSDAPLALSPRALGWSDHLAPPVHDVSCGVHRLVPLRLALSPDAAGSGS